VDEVSPNTLLIVVIVAVLAPIAADTTRIAFPVVVAEILLGIAIGPEVLDWVRKDALIDALSEIGLAFLFFMAGMEIDFARIRGAPARLAAAGWLLSLAVGPLIAFALWTVGVVNAPLLVGLALTTTALGTLLPIIRDAGMLEQRIGGYVLGAGSVGELGPIVALSVGLALASGEAWRTTLLLVFAAAVVAVAALAVRARPPRLVRLVEATMHTSSQLAVRLALLVLVGLFVLARELGLDVILGAFTAGIVVGLVARGEGAEVFHIKLDAIGFGFFIPIFFIATGMDFNLDALVDEPQSLLLVPLFAGLFLLVRGLPAWLLYRRELPRPDLPPLALLSATALPLVVAITEVGTEVGHMHETEAVALVGAGMLSVLAFPLVALALRSRAP
jgi:Kef-type K+ transport system membrane component KefB